TRTDLTPSLRALSSRGGMTRGLATRILLGAQVAISLLLLVGAGLLTRTLRNYRNVDVGFDTVNLLVFRLRPAIQNAEATYRLSDRLVAAIDAVPGVRGSTHSAVPLIAGSEWSTEIRPDRGVDREAFIQAVRSNFLETLRIPLVAGRALSDSDVE